MLVPGKNRMGILHIIEMISVQTEQVLSQAKAVSNEILSTSVRFNSILPQNPMIYKRNMRGPRASIRK